VAVLERPPSYSFQEGKAEVRRDGSDLTFIACGPLVYEAEQAALELAGRNISAAVLNMSSIKPIDEAAIISHAKKTGAIVTAEEHNILGGLGSAVAEVVSSACPVPVLRLGLNDEFGQSGTADALMDHYKLRAKRLVELASEALALKK
jgi:transketolase